LRSTREGLADIAGGGALLLVTGQRGLHRGLLFAAQPLGLRDAVVEVK
jgi:hypothetical protein